MITITKDTKTKDGYILMTEDSEGFHKSMNLTWMELRDIYYFIIKENKRRLQKRWEEKYV